MLKQITLIFVAIYCTINLSAQEVSMRKLTGIYAGDNPSEPIQKAITDFNLGMFYIYRYKIPVLKHAPDKNDHAVILGSAAVELGLISKDEIAKVTPNGFVIKCIDRRIAIVGADSWSIRYGIGRFFIEKQGLKYRQRFLWAAPKDQLVKIEPFTIFDKPTFVYRNGHVTWLGLMWDEFADPRKGADSKIFEGTNLWVDHTTGYLIPKDLYYDKHPEYYAMLKNGKRVAKDNFRYNGTPLCLSNPDVLRISAERAVKWVEKEIDKKFFFITYGDTPFWCQCPKCLALDEKPGEYASRLLYWVNLVAKAVSKKFPDKIMFTFAYGGSDIAPQKIKPADNVGIIVATSLGNIPFWDHAEKSKNLIYVNSWKRINDWFENGSENIFVCEYLGGSYQPAFIEQTANRYRSYAEKGIKGTVFMYGTPVNFKQLWFYLHGKLLWVRQAKLT